MCNSSSRTSVPSSPLLNDPYLITAIGHPTRITLPLLRDRNGLPKPLRSLVVCIHDCVCSPRPVQVPYLLELLGSCLLDLLLRSFCQENSRSPNPHGHSNKATSQHLIRHKMAYALLRIASQTLHRIPRHLRYLVHWLHRAQCLSNNDGLVWHFSFNDRRRILMEDQRHHHAGCFRAQLRLFQTKSLVRPCAEFGSDRRTGPLVRASILL